MPERGGMAMVLDASALLAALGEEPGGEDVEVLQALGVRVEPFLPGGGQRSLYGRMGSEICRQKGQCAAL